MTSDKSKIDKKISDGEVYVKNHQIQTQSRAIYIPAPKDVVRRKARVKGIPLKLYILTHSVQSYFDDFGNADFASRFMEKPVKAFDENLLQKIRNELKSHDFSIYDLASNVKNLKEALEKDENIEKKGGGRKA